MVELKWLGKAGSNHFPMMITLNFMPEEKADQHKIKAESDTKEKADKIIKKGLQTKYPLGEY